ncbi:MAG: endonuclease/exonuclease/phosphatase family protein [Sandaracinaceae bacterium]|nr:endonuclease/exonuclease/phosphatase family protein [Sandaracinaceae bacterium]
MARDLRLAPRSVSELRVMSFNLRWDGMSDGDDGWSHRHARATEMLAATTPDVVGLQEASEAQVEGLVGSMPELAVVGGGAEDGARGGLQTAILFRMDRLEAQEAGIFWLSDQPGEPGSRTWGNGQPRTCTWARFRDRRNGLRFVVYNTHLDHRSAAARERGLALLAERVRATELPAIVMGDLNLEERDAALRGFLDASRLRDSLRAVRPEPAADEGTFHGFRGATDGPRVDYVLVPPAARVRSVETVRRSVDGRYPSDHFPVLAVVQLDGPR